MRSYIKAYRQGRVFYRKASDIPGFPDPRFDPTVYTLAIERLHQGAYIDALNIGYNTFIGGISYVGNDDQLGVPLASLWAEIQGAAFIPYEEHPLN